MTKLYVILRLLHKNVTYYDYPGISRVLSVPTYMLDRLYLIIVPLSIFLHVLNTFQL